MSVIKEDILNLVTIEQQTEISKRLTEPAADVDFPLSAKTRKLIDNMLEKTVEMNAAGFAASQFGEFLRIIVYRVSPASIEARSLDPSEEYPLTVLINPSYEEVEQDGKNYEWEGCFSVESLCGKPPRYNTIHYQGYNLAGEKVQGVAKGFLARVMQHEIDHTDGILLTERLTPECQQGSPKEMVPIREKEYAERKALKNKPLKAKL
jgi:peptide deformylase